MKFSVLIDIKYMHFYIYEKNISLIYQYLRPSKLTQKGHKKTMRLNELADFRPYS